MAAIAAGPGSLPPWSVTLPAKEDFVYNLITADGSDWPDGTGAQIILEPIGAADIVWTATVTGPAMSFYVTTEDLQPVIAARPKTARLDYLRPTDSRPLLWTKGPVYVA